MEITTLQEYQLQAKEEVRWASIRLSEVFERGKRLNATYYDVEGKKARQLIENCQMKKIFLNNKNGFASVWYHTRFKRIYVEEGIPIYTASQILELIPASNKFVSAKTNTNFKTLELKSGQIVMTRSGSIGFSSLVSRTLAEKVFTDDLLRIECYRDEDIGFLYAFLKTRIGRKLVSTNDYGSVVTHIEPEHFEKLLVPNPSKVFKDKINKMIYMVFRLRDEANDFISDADKILFQKLKLKRLKELNPSSFHDGDVKNFEKKASRLQLRFETSFHNPLIDEINKELKSSGFEITTIGDKRISDEIILPGRFKRIYVEKENGIPFLGGKDIMQFDPPEIKYLSLKGHSERIEKELNFQENMVLITCSGTVGNVILSPEHFKGSTGSQHIIRIVPSKKMNPGYLYAFLASEYGYELIKRNVYGSVVDEIDDNQISNVPIPLPNPKIMDEIGNLILTANKKRTEAYHLEKKAIKSVEDLIFNNQTA